MRLDPEEILRRQLILLAAATLGMAEATFGQTPESTPGIVPPGATYLSAAGEHDHPLIRWRIGARARFRALGVYYEPDPSVGPGRVAAVERAFATWNRVAELPVRFRRTLDPAVAEVRIRWVDEFDRQQAGLTEWVTDGEGWILGGTITLARRHRDGLPMSNEYTGLVALHEIGHLVGLPHSEDPGDVMHPGNRNTRLSVRDRRSVAALYARPASDPAAGP
ncbi:MAG: matrixin family metalloprotease [Gemmatimonadota bacterium]